MGNAGSSLIKGLLRLAGRQGSKRAVRSDIKNKNAAHSTRISRNEIAFPRERKIRHPHHNSARKWLSKKRKNYDNPFFVLLSYLVSLNEQLEDIAPVSCSDYKNYFRERCFINDFPFEIISKSVDEREDIIKYIHEFDHAYLGKMVHSVFIGLIAFLVRSRGSIKLLDFGSGQTCGMYGENGRFLFTGGKVNINAVSFWAIDDLHEPSGSIFKKSNYRKCNILSFESSAKFDLITGHHVLEHCYDWDAVIGHVAGLLKKDGYLYLSFPRFSGFYDTVYRLMSPSDHRADFDLDMLNSVAKRAGLEICLSDIYVDPNSKFDWICNIFPELVNKEISDCFYDLCVDVDSKQLLGYHHYGHYVVFRKISE